MPVIERTIDVNEDGYREVGLEYRVARAAMLDANRVAERTERICCPMLDACRSSAAYGEKALQATDSKALAKWSEAVGVSTFGIKAAAYTSGPWYRIAANVLLGRFDETEVDGGFLRSLKDGIDTGVLATGCFRQSELDELIWAFHPDLRGTAMTADWLYTVQSERKYLDESMLPAVLEHNRANAHAGKSGKRLGLFLSTFEMKKLLLGPLSQEIQSAESAGKIKAIALRDLHDFFKYGLLPVQIEERFVEAKLLSLPEVCSPASERVQATG